MSNDLTTTPATHQPVAADPFQRMVAAHAGVNVGAVSIEQERAIAEAQGQLILAKRFPRGMAQARAEFIEACKSPEFAAKAFYAVTNRGSGPSIRFAEEAARCYGNFQYGHRELSRTGGKSEVEVFAWDMEKNNHSRRQITVLHVIDTKNGPKMITDQTDIDNRVANVASKQMRGRILALLPKDMVEAGQAACRLTIAGDNDKPVAARVADMTSAYSKYGVNAQQLAAYVGHSLDNVTVDEIVDLLGVYNAIREGAKPSEYFGADTDKTGDHAAGINAALQKAATTAVVPVAAGDQSPLPAATPPSGVGSASASTASPAAAAGATRRVAAVKTTAAAPPPPPPPIGADGPPDDDPPPDGPAAGVNLF